MSRIGFLVSTAFLLAIPCAARADVYPVVPAPPAATPASPRQVFRWLDTNQDGYLSLGEFLAAPWIANRAQATNFFYWMDTNHDGLVSLPEYLAAYKLYIGGSGYQIRTNYPWAWACWRPWRYGWYWSGVWRRHAGVWPAYVGNGHVVVRGSNYAVGSTRRNGAVVKSGRAAHIAHPGRVAAYPARPAKKVRPGKQWKRVPIKRHSPARGGPAKHGAKHAVGKKHGASKHSKARHGGLKYRRSGKHGGKRR